MINSICDSLSDDRGLFVDALVRVSGGGFGSESPGAVAIQFNVTPLCVRHLFLPDLRLQFNAMASNSLSRQESLSSRVSLSPLPPLSLIVTEVRLRSNSVECAGGDEH